MTVTIRLATLEDTQLIAELVRELAEYEKLAHEAVATAEDFRGQLFGPQPKAHALIVEHDGRTAGFAIYFYNFSTFLARPGIYVEDVYIRPEFRRHGFGGAVFKYLAQQAVAEGCGRMEWSVLDWNEPAIRFYGKIGAKPMNEWTVQRLTGDALRSFAES